MFLGDESDNNLLHSELARFDFTPLEEKATSLREVLIEKGWSELLVGPQEEPVLDP